jgi:hypothetical protein
MRNNLVERYWVDSPKLFAERMKELVALHPDKIEPFELCQNNLGQSVPGCRMGKGTKHVFLLGREHGHEPVGTCGLAALMEGLAEAKVPDSNQQFSAAEAILDSLTLHLFPLMNPDAADRMSKQVKDSFPADQFIYSKEDSDKYRLIHSEPGLTLNNDRPPHYTPEEMEIWRQTGKPIGTLFTEDGVELWMDWHYNKAPQTKAIKKLMYASPPYLFVDIHGQEAASGLAMPAGLSDEGMTRHRRLGNLLYEALEEVSLPFYPREVGVVGGGLSSIEWVRETFGGDSCQFLYEVHNGYHWFSPNVKPEDVKLPIVSKAQIILSVWYGITALLKGALEESD